MTKETFRKLNPGLVYVAASGWGQDGPLSAQLRLDIMAHLACAHYSALAAVAALYGPAQPVSL
jgi:crotonobetainyl-CoA:carnitine CoA-transferase CaiB-like acyl-CoA transferase